MIAQELSKFAEELSPEMMGRIAGMIAYELVLEAGIASAAVATAGAASTPNGRTPGADRQQAKEARSYR